MGGTGEPVLPKSPAANEAAACGQRPAQQLPQPSSEPDSNAAPLIALEGSSGETGEQEQPKNEPVIIEDTQEQEQDQPPQAEELQLDLSRNDLHFKGSKFKHDGRQPCEGHFPAGLRGGGGSARLRRLGRCCIQCSRVPGRYMLHAGFILMMALHT